MCIFKIIENVLDAQTGVLQAQDSRVNTLFNQTASSLGCTSSQGSSGNAATEVCSGLQENRPHREWHH